MGVLTTKQANELLDEIESLKDRIKELEAELNRVKGENINLRRELKDIDFLIQDLYDKTRGKQPF
jgi:septal ring factor EnvC (AmiA/AmiB activator)